MSALGRHPRALAAGALGATAAAAVVGHRAAQRQAADLRRRVEADPAHALLSAPLEGRRVPVEAADGTELHAEAFGPEDAPTLVLVHGWTCALQFWTAQIQALSDEIRVVAYDLRGHGRSERPRGGDYAIETFADDLDAVLGAALPDGQRAVVAGHSLGAMVAVAWAGRHADTVGDRVAAAGLVNTGVGDLISDSLVVGYPARVKLVEKTAGRALLGASAPLPARGAPFTDAAVKAIALGPDASPAQVSFCADLVFACRREVRAACGGTLSQLDLRDSVASLAVPTAVLAGERDKLTPPVHAQRLADDLPDVADRIELPRIGHMAPVEAPDAVTSMLRRLVGDHAAARPAASPSGAPRLTARA